MIKRGLRSLVFALLIGIILGNPMIPAIAPVQAASHKPHITDTKNVNKSVIHIKFTEQSGANLDGGVFSGTNAQEFETLNEVLASAKKINAEGMGDKNADKSTDPVKLALKDYYKIRFAKDVDVESIVDELQALSIVSEVYAEQKPAPLPSADYRSLQTYLNAAPTGVNRAFAASYPGGKGDKVKIVDIEYSWNVNHEDLTKARAALVPNGTPVDPFNDNNHGTAAIGQMIADDNISGVTGVSSGAGIELINSYSQERGWDIAGALAMATARTQPGDVIIIEQQAFGPAGSNGYVPVEWIPVVYDAIKAATDSGRIIIEPAGNGNQNLDNINYYGSSFPAGKPNSGAIIVGAGEACNSSQARARLNYSNYGSRVDVQGPGNCVATTGWYGDLYSAGGVNRYYTRTFNGTSSASSVVAASAASFSSAFETLNGRAPTPQELRTFMVSTGTAQNTAAGMLTGKIGTQPNLAKMLPKADKVAPGIPKSFTLALSTNKPNLKWLVPSDNVKVTGYQIYRDGKLYKTVTGTSFRDAAAVNGRRYTYKVRAYDAGGNYSGFTPQLAIVSK